MPFEVIFYSHLPAAIGYGLLAGLLGVSSHASSFGRLATLAAITTSLWAAVIVVGTFAEYPPVDLIQLSELLRDACWAYLLLKAMDGDSGKLTISRKDWRFWFVGILLTALLLIFLFPEIANVTNIAGLPVTTLAFTGWVGLALAGLIAVEQLVRNSDPVERWTNKFLCLGVGTIFAYDFFMYADALLFGALDPVLWQARGFATTLAVPLIAIAAARNPVWNLGIQVSRQVAFHSVTLMGAGFYLLAMATAGYFIKYLGGSWGGVIQVLFLSAAGILLLALLFSGKIRANLRVFLSKHFFTYRYDYREEWLKFTQALASGSEEVPERILKTIAALMESQGGLLWVRAQTGEAVLRAELNMELSKLASTAPLNEMMDWMESTQWIIDIEELTTNPMIYEGLSVPEAVTSIRRAWLFVPLLFEKRVIGLILIARSNTHPSVNWEDRDLLKTAGHQAASYLALHLANQALLEARQFDAFNRLSAYVVHDLKNILAQQSLIVTNAAKHKRNPEFVDDVITTVGNSVDRMTKLMEQMRSGVRGSSPTQIDLRLLLSQVIARRSTQRPVPTLHSDTNSAFVHADRDQLANVFGHIIQNAQEATQNTGRVSVTLSCTSDKAVVEIRDDGVGMDETFVRHRLFRPFDSTKGLTGMGIGAFESREFIRAIRGDIDVSSKPGEGAVFRIVLPCEFKIDSEFSPDE